MSDILSELRRAARGLARSPGFTLAAVLTLAVGIGANTAIFAMLDRLLLRPLPVASPRSLVHVVTERESGINFNLSYPAFSALREDSATFAGVLASTTMGLGWTGPDGTVRIAGAAVSGEYFAVLGIRPLAGRWFAPDEAVPGRPASVAVVSHGFWTRSLGADPRVVGRELRLNDHPFTVIGVAPPAFTGMERGSALDVWIPIPAAALVTELGEYASSTRVTWLNVFARLAPGVSREGAQAAVAVGDAGRIAAGVQRPNERTLLHEGSAGLEFHVSAVEQPLTILMAAVVVMLLIACGNVAALLLVRGRARRREIAIRVALGAGRGRLVRELLSESALLAGVGGTLGLIVALWSGDLLARYPTLGGESLVVASGLDSRVLAFSALTSLAVVFVFGLAPALRASRPDVVPALKGSAPVGAAGRRRIDLRDGLVVGQVALAVVLLVSATLLVRTVRNLGRVDVGFDARGVLMASLDLEARRFERDQYAAFYDQLMGRLRALPGVEAATAATTVWPHPGGEHWGGFALEGFTGSVDDVSFDVNRVGPDYFETLRVPVLSGRGFDARDRGSVSVAIVNETMARRYWPDQGAVGRHIDVGPDSAPIWIEIVGVVGDGKYRALREPPSATAYLPLLQAPRRFGTLFVRAAGDPVALAHAVRREVAAVDPGVPVYNVRTLETHVGYARSRERLASDVVALFGIVSLGLAALGLYGVLAAAVTQRTREIGVRVALGARAADVTGLFLRRAGLLVVGGALLGAGGALASTRLLRDLLFGVAPGDPQSVFTAVGALAVAALLAILLPVRRAARLDPVEALRHE